ncbi:MAG: hypothetical protein Q9207_005866 [Kuettlingeria erythrocarpa]
MSCPLSAILNTRDEVLQVTPSVIVTPRPPQAPQIEAPSTPPNTSGICQPQHAGRKRRAFAFSPDRGQLYDRRVRRKLGPMPPLILRPPKTGSLGYHDDPAPPSLEIDFTRFNILTALLEYSELTFEVVKYLDPRSLLDLYSTSRDFHILANTRFTTMILSISLAHAPESSRIFDFRCYRSLCIRDPLQRPIAANAYHNLPNEIRYVPGFQWLGMVVHREQCVDEIVACLDKEGLMLPKATTLTIKKWWFTMDLPTNAQRGRLLRNKDFWSDQDLYLATLFTVKLDMLCTCPMVGEADLGLRKLLLGQRSLATLASVLKRETMRNQYEMLRMIVEFDYERNEEQTRLDLPILGVKPEDIGKLQYEGWGKNPGVRFQQVDELVVMESVRRGLDMPKHYVDMILYGFVDKGSGLDIWNLEQRERREREMEKGDAVVAGN